VEDRLEAERSRAENAADGREDAHHPARGEALGHRCIVGAWTTRAPSASSTSTSTQRRWPGSTNFANISYSDYEFTLTFARIDHEVEEGDVPGVVVARINVATPFMRELLDAMQDTWSKYTTVKGIQDLPETDDRPR